MFFAMLVMKIFHPYQKLSPIRSRTTFAISHRQRIADISERVECCEG